MVNKIYTLKSILFFSLFLIILLTVFSVFAGAVTNVTSCGVLDIEGETYVQTVDIIDNNLTDSCIKITAENIIFDCQNYAIKSDDAYAGVYSNQLSTTVKNCNISMSSEGGSGIALVDSNNSYIHNNILNNQGRGLVLLRAFNTKIEDNTMNSNVYGIHLTSASGNNLTNNTAGSGLGGDGIYLRSSSNNIIKENIVNFNSVGYGNGISIGDSSSGNSITGNTANSNEAGIVIFSNSENNIIENNIFNSNYRGISLSSGSDNNIIINNIIESNDYGIDTTTDHNQFINNILNLNGEGIDIGSDSNNITGGSISNGTGEDDIFIYGNSKNNIFLDVIYDVSKEYVETGGELIRKWYYKAYVNDTNGNAVSNADVTAYNKSADLIESLTTDGTGWTELGELIDYVNDGGTRTYYSDYTIKAGKSGFFDTETHIYNITSTENILDDVFTLDINGPTISFIAPTPADKSNQTEDNIIVNVSASDTNNISTFIDFDNSLVGWWRMDELKCNPEAGICTEDCNRIFEDETSGWNFLEISDLCGDSSLYYAVVLASGAEGGVCNLLGDGKGTYSDCVLFYEHINDELYICPSYERKGDVVDENDCVCSGAGCSSPSRTYDSIFNFLNEFFAGPNAVSDYSGYGNDGTKQGDAAQTESGKLGKGFEFDGNGDYVDIGSNALVCNLDSFSISAWFKTTTNNTVYIYSESNSTDDQEYCMIDVYLGSTLRGVYSDGSFPSGTSTTGANDGEWHHVVYVRRAADSWELFFDGNSVDTDSTDLDALSTINNAKVGGLITSGTTGYFDGELDDVMTFKRALSAEEISGLYANENSKIVSNDFTNLEDGSHTFKAYSQDISGNVGETEKREVTII
jgi:parallel beta-helix repeat protein